MKPFHIGERVVSLPVGCMGAFKGKIVGTLPAEGEHDQYLVRDDNGREWLRERRELQHIRGRKPKVQHEAR